MRNFFHPFPKEVIYIIVLVFILMILIAVFIFFNPDFLFGYYSPGFLGWPGYLPLFGSAYNGFYSMLGFRGIYPYLISY